MKINLDLKKKLTSSWFAQLQETIRYEFEKMESEFGKKNRQKPKKFEKNFWKKSNKKKDSRIILMTTKGKKKFNEFKFNLKDTILFGRESKGVPEIVHKNSFQRLKIPIKKHARSLNIGMAVAITLSEALRQNNLF